ncbi:hypothetical protein D3C72_2016580 [compost metagenome]
MGRHIRILGRHTLLNSRLPIRKGNDRHPAAGNPEIQQLIDIPLLFHKYILTDNSDVGYAVLHIGRDINRLGKDKLHTYLWQWNNQLARIIHVQRDVQTRFPE